MKKFLLAAAMCVMAGQSVARPPLAQVAEIRNGLIIVGIAYELSEVCDSLDARTFKGLLYLNNLKSKARNMGYSSQEIDAFVKDKAEKKKLESQARTILANMGAVKGQPKTYCTVGHAEIAKKSAIGRLLR